jgi:hypothetical protein
MSDPAMMLESRIHPDLSRLNRLGHSFRHGQEAIGMAKRTKKLKDVLRFPDLDYSKSTVFHP